MLCLMKATGKFLEEKLVYICTNWLFMSQVLSSKDIIDEVFPETALFGVSIKYNFNVSSKFY